LKFNNLLATAKFITTRSKNHLCHAKLNALLNRHKLAEIFCTNFEV